MASNAPRITDSCKGRSRKRIGSFVRGEVAKISNSQRLNSLQLSHELLAQLRNNDRVPCLSSFASRLLSEFFHVPGPSPRKKATDDNSHLTSLHQVPDPIIGPEGETRNFSKSQSLFGEKLGMFSIARVSIQGERYIYNNLQLTSSNTSLF